MLFTQNKCICGKWTYFDASDIRNEGRDYVLPLSLATMPPVDGIVQEILFNQKVL